MKNLLECRGKNTAKIGEVARSLAVAKNSTTFQKQTTEHCWVKSKIVPNQIQEKRCGPKSPLNLGHEYSGQRIFAQTQND